MLDHRDDCDLVLDHRDDCDLVLGHRDDCDLVFADLGLSPEGDAD